MSDSGENVPTDLARDVRAGILAALAQDVELRGGRTARRLASAGLVGVAGAVGATLIVSAHPFGHHPYWHAVVFSTVWAGLLIVSLSLLLLRVRTPELPIARAAAVGLGGLGLAGICNLLCPDPHVMGWWLESTAGAAIAERTSPWSSALCFGFGSVFLFALVPGVLLLPPSLSSRAGLLLTAFFVTVLLLPGVALASFGLSLGVFLGWLAGVVAGACAGVAVATRLFFLRADRFDAASR